MNCTVMTCIALSAIVLGSVDAYAIFSDPYARAAEPLAYARAAEPRGYHGYYAEERAAEPIYEARAAEPVFGVLGEPLAGKLQRDAGKYL